MPVVASVAMAKKMEKDGADAIIAEGTEAGGHIGELTTMVLVPQVVDAVSIPVVAAGGIADSRGAVAAFALGADGIQVGTRFICSTECIAHYDCQVTIKDDEGNNQRPDVVLYLPEGKRIVIDSKVSLTAYVEWVGAEEEAARTRYLAAHVASVRQHVNELSRKEYQRLLESPDFVIMFIPNEPAFLAAMQHDSAIWSDAYERKVIISSPTNLFALLKLVDDLWRRNEQSRNQEQIIKYGTTLYEQFVAFAASLEGVGQALDLARAKYDDAYKRLHTGNNNIVRTGERLRRLGLPTAKRPSRRLLDETDGLDAEEELPAAGDGGHDRQ